MGRKLSISDESSVDDDCCEAGIASYILKSTGFCAISFEERTLGLASNLRVSCLVSCHDLRTGRKTSDWNPGLLLLNNGIPTMRAVVFWLPRSR